MLQKSLCSLRSLWINKTTKQKLCALRASARNKFDKNVARDKRNIEDLEILGWNVIVVWECELKDPDEVMRSIKRRLNPQTAAYIVRPTPPLLAAEEVAGYRSR